MSSTLSTQPLLKPSKLSTKPKPPEIIELIDLDLGSPLDYLPFIPFYSSDSGSIVVQEIPPFLEPEINGSDRPEQLVGDDRRNIIIGKGGDDKLSGRQGSDVMDGGSGKDRLLGNEGHDRLYGNGGNDILLGGTGNDLLHGGSGNDRLQGGANNDILLGGFGNNTLVGGEGADCFVLKDWRVTDTILDFQDGIDKLGMPVGGKFEDLTIEQQGANTVIKHWISFLMINPPPMAILKGVQSSTITAEDFVTIVSRF
jgi:hypothetical protein